MLLAMVHENPTLPWRAESVLGERNQQTCKLNQLPPVTSNCYETLHVRSAGKYLQVYKDFLSISTVKVKI